MSYSCKMYSLETNSRTSMHQMLKLSKIRFQAFIYKSLTAIIIKENKVINTVKPVYLESLGS